MTRQASGILRRRIHLADRSRRTPTTAYGRVEDAYDADGNETVTSYAVNSAGLTTGVQVAAPSTTYTSSSGTVTTTHVSSETLDPTRGLTLTSTDQNGVVTTARLRRTRPPHQRMEELPACRRYRQRHLRLHGVRLHGSVCNSALPASSPRR